MKLITCIIKIIISEIIDFMILSKVIQWTQKKEMDESPTILQSKWFKLDLVYVYVVCRVTIIDFEWVYGKSILFLRV